MGIFQRRFIYLSEVFLFRGHAYYISFFWKSNFYPIFPIISSSFSIFSVSSAMIGSLLFDASSACCCHPDDSCHPELAPLDSRSESWKYPWGVSGSLPPTRTLTLWSSFCDASNSSFCFSRKTLRDLSGSTISDLSELIYFLLSKRFHLLVSFKECQ